MIDKVSGRAIYAVIINAAELFRDNQSYGRSTPRTTLGVVGEGTFGFPERTSYAKPNGGRAMPSRRDLMAAR
jgi:hypothetical protein